MPAKRERRPQGKCGRHPRDAEECSGRVADRSLVVHGPTLVDTVGASKHCGGSPPRLLRSEEAAHYMGVGTRTLWTLTNLRQIQAVRFHTGGRESVRYDREDLDAWIETQKSAPPSGGTK